MVLEKQLSTQESRGLRTEVKSKKAKGKKKSCMFLLPFVFLLFNSALSPYLQSPKLSRTARVGTVRRESHSAMSQTSPGIPDKIPEAIINARALKIPSDHPVAIVASAIVASSKDRSVLNTRPR